MISSCSTRMLVHLRRRGTGEATAPCDPPSWHLWALHRGQRAPADSGDRASSRRRSALDRHAAGTRWRTNGVGALPRCRPGLASSVCENDDPVKSFHDSFPTCARAVWNSWAPSGTKPCALISQNVVRQSIPITSIGIVLNRRERYSRSFCSVGYAQPASLVSEATGDLLRVCFRARHLATTFRQLSRLIGSGCGGWLRTLLVYRRGRCTVLAMLDRRRVDGRVPSSS